MLIKGKSGAAKKLRWVATVGDLAKALNYYLESAEGKSKEEFVNTFANSVLVEKSGIIPLENSSLLSRTKILNDIRDVQHPITDSSKLISNTAKVFELSKRLDSVASDIFVGRAPTNDVVLADPAVSKSHFRFISIPETKHYQLADMFSTNGTYINGKKIDPFEKHQVEDHDAISFGTEYQLVYYSPRAFYEMLIGLKDNESKDREQKQTADDLALLLDSIDKRTTDLADLDLEEESLLDDDIDLDGGKDLAWLDSGLFEGDDFELDLEAPDDSARASTEIETKEQDSGAKLDNQGEEEKMLTEKEVVSSKDETTMTGTSNDGAVQGADETPTQPPTTPGVEDTIPLDDAMGKKQATEAVPAIDDQPSRDPSKDYQLVNEVEEKGGEGERPTSDALDNELGILFNKRMEAIMTRLLEERLPAIVEPIISETIKKLLLSMK
jgi:pSer/pThr/pTyr-binding forkhead associated (FHA) protein